MMLNTFCTDTYHSLYPNYTYIIPTLHPDYNPTMLVILFVLNAMICNEDMSGNMHNIVIEVVVFLSKLQNILELYSKMIIFYKFYFSLYQKYDSLKPPPITHAYPRAITLLLFPTCPAPPSIR